MRLSVTLFIFALIPIMALMGCSEPPPMTGAQPVVETDGGPDSGAAAPMEVEGCPCSGGTPTVNVNDLADKLTPTVCGIPNGSGFMAFDRTCKLTNGRTHNLLFQYRLKDEFSANGFSKNCQDVWNFKKVFKCLLINKQKVWKYTKGEASRVFVGQFSEPLPFGGTRNWTTSIQPEYYKEEHAHNDQGDKTSTEAHLNSTTNQTDNNGAYKWVTKKHWSYSYPNNQKTTSYEWRTEHSESATDIGESKTDSCNYLGSGINANGSFRFDETDSSRMNYGTRCEGSGANCLTTSLEFVENYNKETKMGTMTSTDKLNQVSYPDARFADDTESFAKNKGCIPGGQHHDDQDDSPPTFP